MPGVTKAMSRDAFVDPDEPLKRRRRGGSHHCLAEATPLDAVLAEALPDKEALFPQWLEALAAPSVSITSLEDVARLDPEDIGCLPVPPLVKGVFRQILARKAAKEREEQQVLAATAARQREFLAQQRDRQNQPLIMRGNTEDEPTYSQDLKSYRLILTREELEAGVRIVARRIETWCKGERIVFVGILSGAFMFLSDLCRALVRPYSVYFVEASSYKDGRNSGGVQINKEINPAKFCDPTTKTANKVVLVDELLDNGATMQEMKQFFLQKLSGTHTENDILTVCLLSKERQRGMPEADITGIPNVPDLWLVGYGLDDRGTKRGWTELFAIPKVKIVETLEVEEVDRLLDSLDDDARLTGPLRFAGFELPFDTQRFRVSGLNVHGGVHGGTPKLHRPEAVSICKADLRLALADLPTVKGKYEQELQFAFIRENVALVPEDEIFSGNNQVYAEMRCRLRRHIAVASQRFGVEGPPPPSGQQA